jgi:hypothetical protein
MGLQLTRPLAVSTAGEVKKEVVSGSRYLILLGVESSWGLGLFPSVSVLRSVVIAPCGHGPDSHSLKIILCAYFRRETSGIQKIVFAQKTTSQQYWLGRW